MSSKHLGLRSSPMVVRPSSLAWAVALALATVPLAQATASGSGTPFGSQIVVSPPSKLMLSYREKVAMDAAGDFVVVWESLNQVSRTSSIYAQRYASNGVAEGSSFLVNSYTSGDQEYPAVAMDAAGDFVVAWESLNQVSGTSGWDIYAQRYASNGVAEGSNFLVNSYTSGNQEYPAVAMDAAGDFAVAWESYDQVSGTSKWDIYAQRYASNGVAEGSNFLVNSYTSGNQEYPAVAMDAMGDFVVAWQSYRQASTTSKYDIYAQRYASNGVAEGSNFLVNTNNSIFDARIRPAVAMDAAGDFVVSWDSFILVGYIDSSDYARCYSASGLALSSDVAVSPFVPASSALATVVFPPAIAVDAIGDFVVAQGDYYATQTSGVNTKYSDIVAQRYAGEDGMADVSVTGVSSDTTVLPGSGFSVSLEVVNRTVPAFETADAYLNRFIGGISHPTIQVTLPTGAIPLPVAGANWSCLQAGVDTLSCTYAGSLVAGQYSAPLMMSFIAPDTVGTLDYGAQVSGSSEPAFTGSVTVANPLSGNGGGGGFGWIELLGLLGFGVLAKQHRKLSSR
ncbi:MAG: hypothetical protein ACYCS1_01855 [Gammaproteobacteria bacterium]